MVHAYAYRRAVFAAQFEERHEFIVYFGKFSGIFLVGELHFTECAPRIEKIAGVDTYFLHVCGGFESCGRIEVYVGHKRHIAACASHGGVDIGQFLCVSHSLGCEADQFGSGCGNRQCLCGRSFDIECRGSGHGLKTDRISASYGCAADVYLDGFTPEIIIFAHCEISRIVSI